MTKKKTIFLIIVSFLLTISLGYAFFSQNINISGTSTAMGTFDVQFYSAAVSSHVGSTDETAVIDNANNRLDITVPKLAYPGAYTEFTIVVKNVGTIPARLTDITPSGFTSDPNITITSNVSTLQNAVMASNGTQTFTLRVTWNANSQQESQNVHFSLALNYTQGT